MKNIIKTLEKIDNEKKYIKNKNDVDKNVDILINSILNIDNFINDLKGQLLHLIITEKINKWKTFKYFEKGVKSFLENNLNFEKLRKHLLKNNFDKKESRKKYLKEYQKKYYQKNKQKINNYKREYYKKMKELKNEASATTKKV